VEAVQRNPQAASSLQIGMFFEDRPAGRRLPYNVRKLSGHGDQPNLVIRNDELVESVFDCVPASMFISRFRRAHHQYLHRAPDGHGAGRKIMAVFLTIFATG